MKKHLLILFLFITELTSSFAYENFNFHVLDVRSGISDNYIQDILHDKYGFMWFATRNGLSRYDGYHYKQYTITQLGSYDNNFERIFEDGSGTIWIKSPILYCFYNREEDAFDNNVSGRLAQYGVRDSVEMIYIDEDRDLWCVAGNTLYYHQFKDNQTLEFIIPDNLNVTDITCRQLRGYLLMSDGSIYAVDRLSHTLRKETQISSIGGFQPHIYIDSAFCLWLYATHGSDLTCYSTKDRQWVKFPGQEELSKDHCNITTVTDDGMGNIWIGTDNKGIYISHIYEKQFTLLYKEPHKEFSLPSNHITCFLKDNKNIMWIGTSKQGVTYSCLNNVIFENNKCKNQEDVSCLLEDKEGNLWLGFDGEGIARYDKHTNRYNYFKSKDNMLPSNLIVCSFLDSKGRIWWGSFGDGAFYFENGKFIIPDLYSDSNIEKPNYIRRIIEDINGNIWLATFTQGLYCIDTNGKFTVYTNENSNLKTNYIADLSCNDGRNLYIATSSGFFHMDTFSRQFNLLSYDKSGKEIIQDEFANCIFEDSRGLLWIGGRKGVNIYNRKENKVVELNEENGISHPYIRAIAEDSNKNIWISTDHGITHVIVVNDPNEKEVKYRCYPYYEKDGISDFTFNNFSIICNKQDEIVIGGHGGFIKIRPVFFDIYSNDRKVIFTELYLANERMDVGQKTSDGRVLISKNIQLLNEITMDYSDRNFALEVSAMDYANRHKLQYVYRFGKKEEWIKLEGNRIYFNKLSPGNHLLEVKVSELQSKNESASATLIIHVKPPFWLSNIAYCIYFILIISIIVFSIFDLRRKHKKMLIQQKRDMEIAQQHEMDEAKIRFFTNVSHDLRTPLSLIITPLERIMSTNVSRDLKEDMELMHRNASILMDEVDQLLDFRKLDKQKASLAASYGNLSVFIEEISNTFHSLAAKNKLQLDIRIIEPDLEMNFDRNKLQRVILNLISNALKYNVPGGTVTVLVDKIMSASGSEARISVIDTGIGIKAENRDKIFDRFFQEEHTSTTYVGNGIGLHIVKEYVSLHGGSIEVMANEPSGSIFTITLPMDIKATTSIPSEIKITENESISENESLTRSHSDEKVNILIVEDNEDFRSFIINCLKDFYEVFDASNGVEALSVLENNDIKMVISDVMMPVMDGMELCQKIKNNIKYSHIPVILLTARTADEHILNGLQEGADDYITKPFNLKILLLRIRKLLEWSLNVHNKFKTIDLSPSEITVSNLDEKLIEKAMQALEENMDNSEFSVEDLSACVNMSRGHLYKKLMSITGKSPIEFIRIMRIKRGRQLLEQSQLNISQISYQVGLSPKQFSKYFKEEYGYLPSEYKFRKTEDIFN